MVITRSLLRPVVVVLVQLTLAVALVALAPAAAMAKPADKAPKIPVAFGAWKGQGAGTFKGAIRRGMAKECEVVKVKLARAIIEGEVKPQEAPKKGVVVRVVVKAAGTGEIVESREFTFAKPSANKSQADRMGRAVAEMAQRAPMPPG